VRGVHPIDVAVAVFHRPEAVDVRDEVDVLFRTILVDLHDSDHSTRGHAISAHNLRRRLDPKLKPEVADGDYHSRNSYSASELLTFHSTCSLHNRPSNGAIVSGGGDNDR